MSDDGNTFKWLWLVLGVIGALVVLSMILPILWSVLLFAIKWGAVLLVLYGLYRFGRSLLTSDESESDEVPDTHLLEAESELDDLTEMEHDRELAEFKAKLDAEQQRD